MKILLDGHMIGQKQTGTERYWKNLAIGLKKFIPAQNISLYSNLPEKNLSSSFKKLQIYAPMFKNGLYRIFLGFIKAQNKFKPNLIHVQNFTPFIKSYPIITTIHDLCFKVNFSWFGLKTKLAFNYFFKRSLSLSDAIICISKTTKKMLLEHYSINPKKIFMIYDAADPSFYFIKNKKMVKKNLWQKFRIKDGYFLVVGNVENRKSPWTIINTFNKVVNKYPYVKLVFAGPNKLSIKPSKNIMILNYVSDKDLNILYNGSISLIFFSLCEGFGLPLVEAMTCKTPIICSSLPVFREIANNSAVFVKNNKDLSQAIERFISDKSFKQKYSKLVYQRSKFFSWEKTTKETLRVYNWVLHQKLCMF